MLGAAAGVGRSSVCEAARCVAFRGAVLRATSSLLHAVRNEGPVLEKETLCFISYEMSAQGLVR